MDKLNRERVLQGLGLLAKLSACFLVFPLLAVSQVREVTPMQIQGASHRSPLEGQRVKTNGVVTLLNRSESGFWIQHPRGDGDPQTSDGIYVNAEKYSGPVSKPSVGDEVEIEATVQELQFDKQLPLTRLTEVTKLQILRTGVALPDPVELWALPDFSISEGIAFWERLEGMRVTLKNGLVISPTTRHGEFGVVLPGNQGVRSGFHGTHVRVHSPEPGSVDYNPERILVAAWTAVQVPMVRTGDKLTELVGVVDYTYGNFKIQPDRYRLETHSVPRGRLSTFAPACVDCLQVATFNVENFFDTVDDPQKEDMVLSRTQYETKIKKLVKAIWVEMKAPTLLVLQEVENQKVLQDLSVALNRQNPSLRYQGVCAGSSDGRGIQNAFLVDTQRLKLNKHFLMSTPEVAQAFGLKSESPGREPLVGKFSLGSSEFTVIGNHFKSKNGDQPLMGVDQPPDRGTEVQRKKQAKALRQYVNQLLKEDPLANILLAGDFNDFEFSEPGEGEDHPLGILKGLPGDLVFVNLIESIPVEQRYTFIHEGNAQVLDHMLVSPELHSKKVGEAIAHFNADYPDGLSTSDMTPARVSDHDGVIGYFRF
jgi:predicted extracellular nuclease